VEDKMRLATVGTSFITEHFIAAALKEGSFEVTTVYSRTLDKARVLADQFNIPLIQDDYKALVHDPMIDVIYIATPNDTHFKLAKEALEAQKHVILEKPFVSHSQELRELLEIAKANDRYVFDAIIPMHLPKYPILKEAIIKAGQINHCNLSMVQRSSRLNALLSGEEPAIFSLNHSGGALMDLGIYPISICVGLFGKPKEVSYLCHKFSNGIDLNGVITMSYPDFIVIATIAKDSTGLNFMTFSGDKGHILVDKTPSLISSIAFVEKDKTTELAYPQDASPMIYEIKDFYEVITQKDTKRYEAWMKLTSDAFEVVDLCRKKADLVFTTDRDK
jgi:predicted dehydrogenase